MAGKTPNYISRINTGRTILGIITGSWACKYEDEFFEKGRSQLVRQSSLKMEYSREGEEMEVQRERYYKAN